MENITGNFFLIGLPGVGKTTLGKMLAHKLGKTFIDADQYLVEKTGVTIPTIFELEGELGFRSREKQVIAELTQQNNIVLATGGGVVVDEENRYLLADRGMVIYIYAEPELIYKRICHDKNRPLLQVEDPLLKLKRLYDERHPLYLSVADRVIKTNKHTSYKIVDVLYKVISDDYKEDKYGNN